MKVLFVCKSNIGRSQSAEFFFNNHAKHSTASSAGIKPIQEQERLIKDIPWAQWAITALQKYWYDMSDKARIQLTQQMIDTVDKVYILMEELEENLPEFLKNNPKVMFHSFQNTKNLGEDERDKTTQEIKKFAEDIAESLDKQEEDFIL